MASDFMKGVKDGLSMKGIGLAVAAFLVFMGFAFFGFTPESTAAKARQKLNV